MTTSTRSLDEGMDHICVAHLTYLLTARYVLIRRGDVPELVADPKVAREELGFDAPQTLETMCRDLWNWQTKNPKGYGGESISVPEGPVATLRRV